MRIAYPVGIVIAAVFGNAVHGDAQSILGLEDAISIALANNYDIRLARNDSAVAALDYGYRNAVFLPRINATASNAWNRNFQRQEFEMSPDREGRVASSNLNATIGLSWTLFDGMRMFATRQKAEEFITLGELAIKQQVINTVAQVINTYFNIVRQKQQLVAIAEQMSINQTRVDLTQRRLEIGVGAKPDVLQSMVDLNAQRAAQLQQQTLIRQLKVALNQLMYPGLHETDIARYTEYDVSDEIPIDKSITLERTLSELESGSPALRMAQKQIDIAHLTLAELKADRLPTVQFNTNFNIGSLSNNVAINPFMPVFNFNRGLNFGFTVAVPIVNHQNTRRLIEQGELNIGFQRLMLDNQKSLLRLAVINAFQDYLFQQQVLQLEEDNILLARENVAIILETYRLGAATYLQLREAQQSLENAYNRLIAARYNAKVAETELMRLKGGLVR